MRKGNKVRLLKDNSIGIIADIAFFKLNGKKHMRYQVYKRGESEKYWYPEEDFGEIIERCKITVEGERNQVLCADIDLDHEKGEATIHITGRNPTNLKDHRGYHQSILLFMLEGMNKKVKETAINTD